MRKRDIARVDRAPVCRTWFGSACMAFAASAVLAQQQLPEVTVTDRRAVANEKPNVDEPAVTGSRLGLTPRETPATVHIVDRASIEERGARDTQEALRGVPGMNFASSPGFAGFVAYRGFNGSQITQLFNGITVQYDAISARPVDTWIYDRVEVIGGPSSFLYGAGAVGGSINYVTKLAQRGDSFYDLLASYGSHRTYQGAFGINRQIAPGHYARLDYSHRGTRGWVDRTDGYSNSTAFSLLSDLTANLTHTLALEYQTQDVQPYWGTPLLQPIVGQGRIHERTRFRNYNSADGSYEQDVRWIRSITEYRIANATRFKNTLYHYDAERDYRNVETYTFNAANSLVTRTNALAQKHGQTLLGNRMELSHRGTLGSMPSDWAGGLDISFNRQTRYPRSLGAQVISTVNPYEFSTENFFTIPGITPADNPDRTNRVRTIALFLENRTKLLPALSLVTGLRHDRIDLDIRNWRTASATDPALYEVSYHPTTGRVGMVYDLMPTANVYVQYATAADPPAGILATATFSQVRDFNLTRGNQIEAGTKFDFLQRRGTATLAVYRIVRKNLSIADPNNPTVQVPVGQQSSRGVELAAGMRLTQSLRMQGNVAFIDPRLDDFNEQVGAVSVSRAGNRPTITPTRVANLWINYAITPSWDAGIGARAVSKVYGNTANTYTAPGYTLFDASLAYRINRNVSIIARGRNLTDRIYAQTISSNMFYLGEPRTFDVSVRASF